MTDHIITANMVLTILARHVGSKNGVTGEQLARKVTSTEDQAKRDLGAERRVRTLITELRLEGFHICGTPDTGYFMAETADELDGTCMWLYTRAMTTLRQIARMKKVSEPDLRGQLKLPT